MKPLALLITLVFTAGLLVAGQALGAWQADHSSQTQTPQPGVTTPADQVQKAGAAVSLDKDQIRHLQRLLQNNGYDVGEESGIIGPETASAIRQFQEDQGLTVTGVPDQETLRALASSPEEQEYFGLAPEFEQPQQKEEEQNETPQENGGGN